MRRNSGEIFFSNKSVLVILSKASEQLNDDTTLLMLAVLSTLKILSLLSYDFCLFYVFEACRISGKAAIRKDQRGYLKKNKILNDINNSEIT